MTERMSIPDVAIAAAAEAMRYKPSASPYSNDQDPWWDDAKAALEAAAPFIRAQALEDAADVLDAQAANLAAFYRDREMNETAKASYDAISHDARMLRARAATERGQG